MSRAFDSTTLDATPSPRPREGRGTSEIRPREVSPSTTLEGDAELAALLAERIAWFGFGSAALSAAFLTYRTIAQIFTSHEPWGLTFWTHLGSVIAFLGMALAARSRRFAPSTLRRIEAVGILGANACLLVMTSQITLDVRPQYIALLGMGTSLFLRSALVPSSGRFTLLLGAALAGPLAFVVYRMGLDFVPPIEAVHPDAIELLSNPTRYAQGTTVDALAWWAVLVAASAVSSRVIYGLRSEVRAVRKLGRYHLEERLGAGGMGIVYKARHALLERPTAVKVLPPDRLTEEGRRRFAREVQQTAKLRHPSTITVFDYGRTAAGLFYYAMEYVEGATLGEAVAVSGPQPEGRVVAILRAVAGALVEAHGRGLVHRDLKPANIMVHLPHRYGGVMEATKVLDFGLVRNLLDTDAARTQPGTLRGTPQYLSPEAIRDPDVAGAPADLYALGAVGYFLLAGAPVFDGATVIEVCAQHLRDTPVPPSVRRGAPVHPALERLVLACLEKRPEDRPSSALALEEALGALSDLTWSSEDASAWWETHGDAIVAGRARHRAQVSEELDPLRSPRGAQAA